ncbi:unnamed protein product, partial [Pylaiella littoralis]
ESVGEQIGSLTESFQGEFGEGMSKMVSDLETAMGQLEEKMEGEVAERLGECTEKIKALEEQMQDTTASTAAVETVHDTLVEQAKAQEEIMLSSQENIREVLEKEFNQRLSRVTNEMALLGTRVGKTESATEASSNKVNAVSSTTKAVL